MQQQQLGKPRDRRAAENGLNRIDGKHRATIWTLIVDRQLVIKPVSFLRVTSQRLWHGKRRDK
jgi:hypothetical protein